MRWVVAGASARVYHVGQRRCGLITARSPNPINGEGELKGPPDKTLLRFGGDL